MRKMTSNEIRKMWYKFFESHGHKRMESASLIPVSDDSLLWVNAGVTPLKKYFDGSEVPENRRIVSVQKCIRTNDIENVGLTKRHQTFFEMMGNFSIGDYFKEEAIEFAFELLTSKEYFAIPKEKLYMTIYTEDKETYQKWISLGVDPTHLIPLKENFWEIGEGPCGPDSEIFYDRGKKYDTDGHAFEHFKNDEEQERFVEIWNNVFSQFNAKTGLPRDEYPELPSKNIDTGAGLERWACIFQDVDSNFDTDLFVPLISAIEEMSGVLYNGQMEFKVIADHIRAITMALTDGASFENVGRGYILRRLLRRSVRMGRKLGLNGIFLYPLVDEVVNIMGDAYPLVVSSKENVKKLILEEEELFSKTLHQGERRLMQLMRDADTKEISAEDVFKLYDTYGFPFELTLEYLEEKGFTTSRDAFDALLAESKNMARNARRTLANMNRQNESLLNFTEKSDFYYDKVKQKGKISCLLEGEDRVSSLKKKGFVILDKTCFYAESGGQVADTGLLVGENFKARVIDVQKAPNGQNLHEVKILDGQMQEGDVVSCNIDISRREKIAINHSSVHLLQYALQTVISDTIKQAGSKVDDLSLRFDFTYTGKIQDEQLVQVERLVNQMIEEKIPRVVEEMTLSQAQELGAMALFTEKYGKIVRVVRFGDSMELCGGCHTQNSANISHFAICSLESKGSNVYRIVAVTKDQVRDALFEEVKPYNDEKLKLAMKAKEIVSKAKADGISLKFKFKLVERDVLSYQEIVLEKQELETLQQEVKNLEKAYEKEKQAVDAKKTEEYFSQTVKIKDVQALILKVENKDMKTLKTQADELCNQLMNGFVFFVNICGQKASVIVKSGVENISASRLLKDTLSSYCTGGGSDTFAQGGISNLDFVDDVLALVRKTLGE